MTVRMPSERAAAPRYGARDRISRFMSAVIRRVAKTGQGEEMGRGRRAPPADKRSNGSMVLRASPRPGPQRDLQDPPQFLAARPARGPDGHPPEDREHVAGE